MHTQTRPRQAARVAVRRTEWDRRMSQAGYTTHVARGRALGVDRTTAARVGSGDIPPSAAIIARALAVLDRRFDDLFVVVTDDAPAA